MHRSILSIVCVCMDNRYVYISCDDEEFVILEAKRAKNWYTFVEDYLSNYKLIGIVLFDVLYRDIQKGVCVNLCWIRFGVESNFFFNLITCENFHFSLLYR